VSGLERFGAVVLSGVEWLGGVARLVLRVLRVGPRRPFGLDDILHQVVELGVRSLPIAMIITLFIGMILTWQFGWGLIDFGMAMAVGRVAANGLVPELVPTVLAITVGVKMAAGMTAELGSMKVTEQIDAIAALGADPYKKLVWPRIAASTLALPLLVALGNVIALFGGMIIAEWIYGVPAGYFYETYIDELEPLNYVAAVVKGVLFGFLVGTIGCYQGFNTKIGTEAVGAATTETVAATAIVIIIADFYLNMLFF
jgi:phospholipid/cholesterol/gamma-HCH transport system permease protein